VAEEALGQAPDSPSIVAKATTYLGVVESDRANYPAAQRLLADAVQLARTAALPRLESYALAALGRISLLRGEYDVAYDQLSASIAHAQQQHWLSFLPWPQSLLGEVYLLRGEAVASSEALRQAFARACQVSDPCWEGISARGLGLLASATGETDHAFALLSDAQARCARLADPYVWLSVYILDAQCELGLRHGHPSTSEWIDTMVERASRTGMRELIVRAKLHGAALGSDGDATAAALLIDEIDNPRLQRLVHG
jgi:tetratricopeptide (TPR) repeat protein